MKRLLVLSAVLLALSIGAQAVPAEYYYTAHATSGSAVATDWASYFTMTVGANSGGKLLAPGLPTALYNGFYVSSNVPAIGQRSATYSINLPTAGTFEVFTTFGATTSAKTNAKHVVTDKNGSTDWFVDQTVAGALVNTWVSLGIHEFLANDAANTKVVLNNSNQSTSGSLYVGALKFVEVVPEPGSILALGAGLMSMAGMVLRRRA